MPGRADSGALVSDIGGRSKAEAHDEADSTKTRRRKDTKSSARTDCQKPLCSASPTRRAALPHAHAASGRTIARSGMLTVVLRLCATNFPGLRACSLETRIPKLRSVRPHLPLYRIPPAPSLHAGLRIWLFTLVNPIKVTRSQMQCHSLSLSVGTTTMPVKKRPSTTAMEPRRT